MGMYTIKTKDGVFNIRIGPPTLLIHEHVEHVIVCRPMLEAFTITCRGWYEAHPELPERERRLQAWLEEKLIEWYPLISNKTHSTLREFIGQIATGDTRNTASRRLFSAKTIAEDGRHACKKEDRGARFGAFSERGRRPSRASKGLKLILRKPTPEKTPMKCVISYSATEADYWLTIFGKTTSSSYSQLAGQLLEGEDPHELWKENQKRWTLKRFEGNMEKRYIVRSAREMVMLDELKTVDRRVRGFWRWLANTNFSLKEDVVFDHNKEIGKYSLHYGNAYINVEVFEGADGLIKEFEELTKPVVDVKKSKEPADGETFEVGDKSEDPVAVAALLDDYKKHQIPKNDEKTVETPQQEQKTISETPKSDEKTEGKTYKDFKVYAQRITKADLPRPGEVFMQHGEIFGNKIEWEQPVPATLHWSEKCNIQNEPGVIPEDGGWGFAGWIPSRGVYLRYNDVFEGQEHCMRVLQAEGVPVIQLQDPDPDAPEPATEPSKEVEPEPQTPSKENKSTLADLVSASMESEEESSAESEATSEEPHETSTAEEQCSTVEEENILELMTEDMVAKWFERQRQKNPDYNPEFLADLQDSVEEPEQHILHVWPEDACEEPTAPIQLCADTLEDLAEEFREYAYAHCMDEDMGEEEFAEAIDGLCEGIAEGELDTDPELTIAYALDLESVGGQKLILRKPARGKDSSVSTMSKTTPTEEMIAVADVAKMLCNLGSELAKHFELDVHEVVEYLDGVCEDTLGVNPDAASKLAGESENATEQDDEDSTEQDSEDEKHLETYLEAPGAKKNKFWSCVAKNCELKTSYGTVGSTGQTSTKSFATNEEAIIAAQKLIEKKIKGGYAEPTDATESDNDETEGTSTESDNDATEGTATATESDNDATEGTATATESDNESPQSSELEGCPFVYTKGPRKGERCTTKAKGGGACGKHKDCKALDNPKVSETKKETKKSETKKETKKSETKKETKKSKNICRYVSKKGEECTISPKGSEDFCAKHGNTQQALNYKANESPVAKKASKKASKDEKKKGPSIVRDKKANVWLVEGENLIVKSPKSPVVYAFMTKKGEVNKKLNKAAKTLAEELGLETA